MNKRAVEEFEWWHNAVFGKNPSKAKIPHQVLRDYLDALWFARKNAVGEFHNKTITVTKNPILGMLDWDIMIEEGIPIRVEGAKWS